MEAKRISNSKGILLEGPLIINVREFKDLRGSFFESWNQRDFNKAVGEDVMFVQDNHSKSSLGVLRGMHYQLNPKPQGKLVRVSFGKIFDVIIDLRKDSLTYGTWASIELDANESKQFWIPPGFAHGFLTVSEFAEVQYKTTNFWEPNLERSIIWHDSQINIIWPLDKFNINTPFLSEKDSKAPSFLKAEKLGAIF